MDRPSLLLRPTWIGGEVLLGETEVLRRVHRQPEALVPQRPQAALGGELGKGRRLVVAPLGEAFERLVAEDVDAAADPLVEAGRLAEAGDEIALELDHAERRAERDDGDRPRRAALPVQREQSRQIDVHELVPVQCEDVAGLAASCRRNADSAAATEWLALTDRDNLRPDPAERRLEELLLAARAADEHSVDPRRSELGDLVLGQRPPAHLDQRL